MNIRQRRNGIYNLFGSEKHGLKRPQLVYRIVTVQGVCANRRGSQDQRNPRKIRFFCCALLPAVYWGAYTSPRFLSTPSARADFSRVSSRLPHLNTYELGYDPKIEVYPTGSRLGL